MSPLHLNDELSQALNFAANNELKALTYVDLAFSPENISRNTLAENVMLQTGISAVHGFVKSYPDTFVDGNIAGYYMQLGKNGRLAKHFYAKNDAFVLPVVGSMLDWSINHPDLSLTQMLSTTASKSDLRAPTTSLKILSSTMQQPVQIKDMGIDYVGPENTSWKGTGVRIRALVESGIVEVIQPQNVFKLSNPEYRGSKPFALLKPEHAATYKILEIAQKLFPEKEWTSSSLLELGAIVGIVTDKNRSMISSNIVRAASIATPNYFPGAVERRIEFGKQKYSLNPIYHSAVSALIERVVKLDEGPTTKHNREMTDLAIDMYLDAQTSKELAQKSVNDSPYSKVSIKAS